MAFTLVQDSEDGSDSGPFDPQMAGAITAGNLLVVCASHRSGDVEPSSISGSGWSTPVHSKYEVANGSARRMSTMYWKVAGASEPTQVTVSYGSGVTGNAIFAEFSGFTGTITYDETASASNGTSAGTSQASGSGTPDSTPALAVNNAVFRHGSAAGETSLSNSYTEVDDVSSPTGGSSGCSAIMGYKELSTGGATSTTATWSTSALCGHALHIWRDVGGGGSTDGTATPGAISIAVALPAPSTKAGAVPSPAATSVAVALPAPSAGGHASTAPAATSVAVALPAPSPAAGSVPSPAATTVGVAIPQATPSHSNSRAPASTDVAVTLPAPSTIAGSVSSPAALAVGVTLPAAQPQASHTATPDDTVVAVDLPAATASGTDEATAMPAAISVAVTMPQVVLTAGSIVTPAPIALAFLMGQVLASGPVLEFAARRAVHNDLTSTIAHRVTLTDTLTKVQVVNLDADAPMYAFVSRTGEVPSSATSAADDSYTIPPGGVLTWRLSGAGFVVSVVGDGNAYSVVGYDDLADGTQ